ncbi:MAG: hypothetical protein LBD42_00890 [Desulfovibrio sp.]|jgi:hypothetical protein|nr:hypothetical protein [Desulfovibrio sp.]
MIIRDKGPFIRGGMLLLSFAGIFSLLLTPVMRDEKGVRLTGLQYADNVFNELSKGSSDFIPVAREHAARLSGTKASLNVILKKAELAPLALTLLQKSGADTAEASGDRVNFSGDMGAILMAAVNDSDALYRNDEAAVSGRYGGSRALDVASAWWHLLSPCIKEMQKQNLINEAQAVDQVLRRAVEPGSNFFGVTPAKVSDHLLLMTGMLLFYVFYTLWYGFAIFDLFEGIGLTMAKSKVKQEQ